MAGTIKQRIQSLDRGLEILEYVADREQPVRLAELAGLLGIEKSSAHRLARTLAERGYLKQDAETLGYVLHDKVFAIAGKPAARRRVHERARRYLRQLARETGETAHLAVRGAEGVLLVDHEFGENPIAVTTQWGSSEPLHCTALGKALLAGMNKAELREVLGAGPLKRYANHTIIRFSDLAGQCEVIQREKVAFDRAEFRENMNCTASPIYDFRGLVVAAIGISGPADRLGGGALDEAARVVKKCARELSAELGGQGRISPAPEGEEKNSE